MAVKITNKSEKVIGVGDVTVLPEETKEVPPAFERSPILEVYKNLGLITLSGKAKTVEKTDTEKKAEKEQAEAEATAKAEEERKAKLASLKTASDEDVAALANELGINPAECKDQADVRKKVKAALSK
jgi:hypothetical protein